MADGKRLGVVGVSRVEGCRVEEDRRSFVPDLAAGKEESACAVITTGVRRCFLVYRIAGLDNTVVERKAVDRIADFTRQA
jgi:hypothetical protein